MDNINSFEKPKYTGNYLDSSTIDIVLDDCNKEQERLRQERLHEQELEEKRLYLIEVELAREKIRKDEEIFLEQLLQEKLRQEQIRQEQIRQEQIRQERTRYHQLRLRQILQDLLRQRQILQDQLRQDQMRYEEQLRQIKQLELEDEKIRNSRLEKPDNTEIGSCAICMENYVLPSAIIKCGHIYCTKCIIRVCNSEIKKCPLCKIIINNSDLIRVYI